MSPFDPLVGAEELRFSPDGKNLYVAASIDDTVSVFDVDEMTGVLTMAQLHTDGVSGVDGLDDAGGLLFDPQVNHSCEPNCGIRVNETGGHDFVATRDIAVNEEIVSDYAMRNFNVDFLLKQCICGSKRCRGRITGWKDLPAEKKKEYRE